ncbi:hypothetical protein WJX84_003281 [Apatococcus fuscideae]|uniref:WW domain-containing protein n=1 Tax=Apatococcus fuscideae TaxID=2026836 RepID=A0AAW1SZS0_9CHLO
MSRSPEPQRTGQLAYRAEPVRAVTPPDPPLPPEPSASDFDAAAQAESMERKRKAVQPPVPAPAANAKRKKGGKFNKATSQLINKWQSVRQDLETQEKEEGGMDPEALERKRLQDAEAWRLEQLRSGTSSEENANFQPVAGDWRSKVKAAKKAAKGWRPMWDKASSSVYYGNLTTKETSWDRPT